MYRLAVSKLLIRTPGRYKKKSYLKKKNKYHQKYNNIIQNQYNPGQKAIA